MIIIGFENIGQEQVQKNHPEEFLIMNFNTYKSFGGNWLVKFLNDVKGNVTKYKYIFVPYNNQVSRCLLNLKLECACALFKTKVDSLKSILNNIPCELILVETTLEDELYKPVSIEPINNNDVPIDKNKLTLEQLLDENVEITEADVRDLKATQNKLKVGMLLQAKSMLKRVLKLSDVLDKLYDELLDRIDKGLATSDTASLMYTTEYISKALSETNQFIVSLISNDKIQNFFVIDNSSVVNINSDDVVDVEKRERIRKAVDIVMSNLDYFADGEYEKLKNPNVIEVEKGDDNNVGTST